jgi:hypothetical protein
MMHSSDFRPNGHQLGQKSPEAHAQVWCPLLFFLLVKEAMKPLSLWAGIVNCINMLGGTVPIGQFCGNTDSNFFCFRPQLSTQNRKFEIW